MEDTVFGLIVATTIIAVIGLFAWAVERYTDKTTYLAETCIKSGSTWVDRERLCIKSNN